MTCPTSLAPPSDPDVLFLFWTNQVRSVTDSAVDARPVAPSRAFHRELHLLAERLGREWRARRTEALLDPVMRFSCGGLVLGAGTILAKVDASGGESALAVDERHLRALLAAAHLRPAEPGALIHLRKAVECWGRGEVVLADVAPMERLPKPTRKRARHRGL
jgi:hypothetical protein